MIKFNWCDTEFDIADLGGGTLRQSIAGHAHSKNSYELHFIIGGHGKLIIDSKEYSLKSGNVFITGPGIYHEQKTDKNDPLSDIFIYMQKKDGKGKNAMAQTFLDTHFWFTESFESETAMQIVEEYKKNAPGGKWIIAGLMMKLLTEITRVYLPADFKETTASDSLNDKRFIIIENSFLYNSDLTLGELSERIGLCERQAQRLLMKYYGKTFRQKKKEASLQNEYKQQ